MKKSKFLVFTCLFCLLAVLAGCSSDDEPQQKDSEEPVEDGTISEKVFKEKVMNRLWVRTDDESFILADGSEHPWEQMCGEDHQSCNAISFGEGKCTRYFPHSIMLCSVLDHVFGQYDYDYEYDAEEAKIYITDPGDGKPDLWYRIESVDDDNIIFHRDIGYDYWLNDTEYKSPDNYHRIRYRLATVEDIAKFSTWPKSEYWY